MRILAYSRTHPPSRRECVVVMMRGAARCEQLQARAACMARWMAKLQQALRPLRRRPPDPARSEDPQALQGVASGVRARVRVDVGRQFGRALTRWRRAPIQEMSERARFVTKVCRRAWKSRRRPFWESCSASAVRERRVLGAKAESGT